MPLRDASLDGVRQNCPAGYPVPCQAAWERALLVYSRLSPWQARQPGCCFTSCFFFFFPSSFLSPSTLGLRDARGTLWDTTVS